MSDLSQEIKEKMESEEQLGRKESESGSQLRFQTIVLSHPAVFYNQGAWIELPKGTVLHYLPPKKDLELQKQKQIGLKLISLELKLQDLMNVVMEIREIL